jgi:hypothetical protein
MSFSETNKEEFYNRLSKHVETVVKEQIEVEVNREFELLKQRVDERKREIITGVLLKTFAQIDVERINNRVVITIRDEMK